MEISTKNNKLKRIFEDETFCKRRYGQEMSKKINLRLTALRAAESLATFWPPMSGPERCHELKGDLKETFSMDLKHPYRLLFRSDHETSTSEPSAEKERWSNITAIQLTGIEDTHG